MQARSETITKCERMSKMSNQWKVWDRDENYGDVLYKRAVGDLPEMESSKNKALLMKKYVSDNTSLLDVGCGAGHYLRS